MHTGLRVDIQIKIFDRDNKYSWIGKIDIHDSGTYIAGQIISRDAYSNNRDRASLMAILLLLERLDEMTKLCSSTEVNIKLNYTDMIDGLIDNSIFNDSNSMLWDILEGIQYYIDICKIKFLVFDF